MTPHRLPLVPQIMDDPERAILTALEVTLEIAANSLVAAHPELCDDSFPDGASNEARVADILIAQMKRLAAPLAEYRYLLSNPECGPYPSDEEEGAPAF